MSHDEKTCINCNDAAPPRSDNAMPPTNKTGVSAGEIDLRPNEATHEYWIEEADGNDRGPFDTYQEAANNLRITKGEKIVNRDVPRPSDDSNGGQACDVKIGPCACGAWHDGPVQSGQTFALLDDAERMVTPQPVSAEAVCEHVWEEIKATGRTYCLRCRVDFFSAQRSADATPHHRAIGGRPTTCADADEQIVILGREIDRLDNALHGIRGAAVAHDDHGVVYLCDGALGGRLIRESDPLRSAARELYEALGDVSVSARGASSDDEEDEALDRVLRAQAAVGRLLRS